MNSEPVDGNLERHYYLEFAAAYVRGTLPDVSAESPHEFFTKGREAGLRLHRFKRASELPRVRRVLGILRSFAPADLLDIGSGRGVFLWPLLDAFADLRVTACDRRADRVADLQAVARGGIERLSPVEGDVTALRFSDRSFDGVTILEVLEHLPKPDLGAREVLRIARRFIIASVPSKPDDNPEHLQLFTVDSLTDLFTQAADELGRKIRVRCEYVLNHIVVVVTIS